MERGRFRIVEILYPSQLPFQKLIVEEAEATHYELFSISPKEYRIEDQMEEQIGEALGAPHP